MCQSQLSAADHSNNTFVRVQKARHMNKELDSNIFSKHTIC